jgi:hypothetical protein
MLAWNCEEWHFCKSERFSIKAWSLGSFGRKKIHIKVIVVIFILANDPAVNVQRNTLPNGRGRYR